MKKYLITTLVAVFAVLGLASVASAGPVFFNNGMLFNNGGFVNPQPQPQPQPNPFVPFFPNPNGPFVNPFNPFVLPNPNFNNFVPAPNFPFNPNFNPNNPFVPFNPGPFAIPVPPQVFPQPVPMPVPPFNPAMPGAVIVSNVGLSQNPIKVTAGAQVSWINKTNAVGRIVDMNGVFTSGMIFPGGVHTFTFNNAGNFDYKFVFLNGNPGFGGTVIVQ